jgi:membrane protein DedA with SNARE-associated domain
MLESFSNFDVSNLLSTADPISIYITIFASLFLNGLTNLPSSQIVYLTLGYLVSINSFNFYIAILLGALGNTLGNLILYKLVYNNSNLINSKLAKMLNINPEFLEKYNSYFKNKWWGWLILGKLTPSIKVLVPIICGLSKISFSKATIIFFTGSLFWAMGVTYLGFYFGKESSLLEFYLIVTLIYIVIGAIVYKKNNSKTVQ